MARFQHGCLRVESRKEGKTWVLRYYATRSSDGKRVEHTMPIGLVRDLPTESSAWDKMDEQHLQRQINQPEFRGRVPFADLGHHYEQRELNPDTQSITPLAETTMDTYRLNLNKHLLPRWGKRLALGIEPLEIEDWLNSLHKSGLQWPTLDKIRRVMSIVYKHGQQYGLIPRDDHSNPLNLVRCRTTSDYEALVLAPQLAFNTFIGMPEPVRTLTLLVTATGLRISEALGLQWQDVSFEKQRIEVRRSWVGNILKDKPKTKASKAPVPMHSMLAEFMQAWKLETPYGQQGDWVFPSFKLRGERPRTGSMLAKSYLRPAAVQAGVALEEGQRFGFHNLRHSLASFLVNTKTDVKTVQSLLRHANSRTTLDIYSHAKDNSKLAAQGEMLAAIFPMQSGTAVN